AATCGELGRRLLLDKIGYLDRRHALRAPLDDIPVDQEPGIARAVGEHDRLPCAGIESFEKRSKRRDTGPARKQYDVAAAVHDEIAVRHLDPYLPPFDELAFNPHGEPPVNCVGDLQQVSLRGSAR